MDRIIKVFLTLILGMVVAGCTKGYDPEPPVARSAPAPTLTLATLHKLCENGPTLIEEELVVAGTVTTSDREGNFYRTLCIEEGAFGLEILVGGESLYSRYPVGCKLHLRLKGLAVGRSRGVLQVGLAAPAYSFQELDYLAAQPLIDEHLFRVGLGDEPPARRCSISELTPAQCGTLVLVAGLRHLPLDEVAEEGSSLEGYHRFVDHAGEVLHLYVSPYARFGAEPLPTREVVLRGILQYVTSGDYAGYILKPRDEGDIF